MSNLPPGCSVRDIPGNRPEDEAEEAFANMVYNEFEMKMSEELLNQVIEWAANLRADAYAEGYQACRDDQSYADEMKELDKLRREGVI